MQHGDQNCKKKGKEYVLNGDSEHEFGCNCVLCLDKKVDKIKKILHVNKF